MARKGKKHSKEHSQKIGLSNRGKIKLEETKQKISEAVSGTKHYNWQGGISFLPYCQKFNDKLKKLIRDRDNHTCQLCGVKENGKKLSVHHIHYDKENCYPDLMGLCLRCNSKVNSNRIYYESFFMNKLNERGLLFWTQKNER